MTLAVMFWRVTRTSGADNLKTLSLALASYESSAGDGATIAMTGWREYAPAVAE
jgi:hypothetical protein